jgi:nucleotide-binding universal stress UspA family protein
METAIGRPAAEILRLAADTHADVIVMSTHGATGVRKMMFGSVTEHVLRETPIPVLVTPASDPGPASLDEWKQTLHTVLVPVDLSAWTPQQVAVARGLAEALETEIVIAHVLPDGDPDERLAAHRQLNAIIHGIPATLRPSMTIAVGDAAREIAHIASTRNADVIVMGLHTAPGIRHRMGRVTYQLLCQAPTLVLAWPPARTHSGLTAERKASYVF